MCGWSRLASVRQTMPKVSVNSECSRQTMQKQHKKKTQRNQHFSFGCSRLASVQANHASNHLFQFWEFSACQCPFPGVLGLPTVRQTMHKKTNQTKNKQKTLQLGVFSNCQLAVRQTTSTATISSDCSTQSPRLGQGVEGKRVAGKPLKSTKQTTKPASTQSTCFEGDGSIPSFGVVGVVVVFRPCLQQKQKIFQQHYLRATRSGLVTRQAAIS